MGGKLRINTVYLKANALYGPGLANYYRRGRHGSAQPQSRSGQVHRVGRQGVPVSALAAAFFFGVQAIHAGFSLWSGMFAARFQNVIQPLLRPVLPFCATKRCCGTTATSSQQPACMSLAN